MKKQSELEPKDITPEIAGVSSGFEGQSDGATPPVESSVDKRFTVGLNQHLGQVNLRGDTNGPVGRYDWVALYNKQPPSDPNSGYVDWFWVTDKTSMLTNKGWGSGYYAAYISWDYRAGRYVYVVITGPTV